MPNPAITVEQVAKKFVLSHQGNEPYASFRDAMAQGVKNWFGGGKRTTHSPEKEDFYALKNISFSIGQGERVGIIGRNGAGKSTLLKILSRITEPSSGKITIRGRIASLLEVGTGFHPELSGRENIFLNGAILGMARAEIRRKFDEIVAFAEVEKFLDTPVKRYSSGMYVRLAFAVAAHLEPEILIVDEVLAVGDAQFQKKCLGKMEDVSKNDGRTILFVSHNMGVIAQLCERAILLKSGMVVLNDTTRTVIDHYILNTQASSNVYIADTATREKEMFIARMETRNNDRESCENFPFDENITLHCLLQINEFVRGAKLSVTLQNNNGDFLSTFVEDLEQYAFGHRNPVEISITLPARVIAPNSYAFRLAIFVPGGAVQDLVELVCPVRIFDSGTSMALFEGINYGSFFLDYKIRSAMAIPNP